MNGNPGIRVRTPAMRAAVLLKIRGGMPFSAAASVCGMNPTSFFDWKREDPEFAEDCDRARHAFMDTLVDRALAIAGDVKHKDSAAMTQWLLERRFFDFFARKERVRTNDPSGDPVEEVYAGTADETIGSIAERVARVQALLAGAGTGDQGGGPPADSEDDKIRAASAVARPNGLSSP